MSETSEKLIDIAEFYDIDWYAGEFRAIFAHHANAKATLTALRKTHEANIAAKKTWSGGREAILVMLATLEASAMSDESQSDNIAWLAGDDPEMLAAIRQAQEAFQQFVDELQADQERDEPRLEAAVVKAFFSPPNDPTIGEHMFVDDVKIIGDLIHGTLESEPAGIPGLAYGQAVKFPPSRVSDWFFVIDGVGRGGFTLPVMAKHLTKADLAEAKKYPPFMWFPDIG